MLSGCGYSCSHDVAEEHLENLSNIWNRLRHDGQTEPSDQRELGPGGVGPLLMGAGLQVTVKFDILSSSKKTFGQDTFTIIIIFI